MSRVSSLGSRGALPRAEVLLEHAAALPAITTSARFFGVDGVPWTIDKLVCHVFWRAIIVSENDAFMGCLGSHEHGLRGCTLQVEDGEIVFWHERDIHVYRLVSRS